jgi:Flp pilus assembly protein TadB
METIPTLRAESGSPPAGDPTLDTHHHIEDAFHETGAVVRIVAVLMIIAAVMVIALGVFSLIFPIAMVGMVGLVGAVVLFWQAENMADLTKVK